MSAPGAGGLHEGDVQVTILGSGTLVPDDSRRSAAHLVEGDGWSLLLDCGFGVVHGLSRFGIEPRSFTHLALSHFHTDHIGDLAPLLFGYAYAPPHPRQEPFTLLGPPGLRARLEGLALAHGGFVLDPPFPLEVVELPLDGSWSAPSGGFTLRCHPTGHTPEAVAWRVECASGPVVGYTGDTGPEPSVGRFMEGVDLLVSECAFDDPPPWDGHLSPSGVAALAALARPERILLTHVYPDVEASLLPRKVRAAGWDGSVEVAHDGTRVRIVSSRGPRETPGGLL